MDLAKLDELAELRAKLEVQRMDREAERQKALGAIQEQLNDIDIRHLPFIAQTELQVAAIEAEVRAVVLQEGASAKGARLQAIYVKGRTSWDSKALDGYSAAHPEIERFRKVGEPSVTFRSV